MNVVNFHDALRARVNKMAGEYYAMQERVMSVPAHKAQAFFKNLDARSIELARLASRLDQPGDVEER